MLRRQNLWAFCLDLPVANPHVVHAVHQLRDQIKIETGAAERRDLTLRCKNHARILKRVIKIVAGHDRWNLPCASRYSKNIQPVNDETRMTNNELQGVCVRRLRRTSPGYLLFACGCSPPICGCG